MNPKDLLKRLTLEEKASLCAGKNFWETRDLPEKGIPSLRMNDGPNGLRVEQEEGNMGQGESLPATCFPSGATLGSTWDREMAARVGQELAREASWLGTRILLGPAVNLKRSPLCGRNFEYLSEDPLLSGEIGAAYTQGVRREGVDVCPKHYAVNNQETRRMTIDTRVEERPLRELYLESFRRIVEKGQPGTMMCAYNAVNGDFCSENKRLLDRILREEWGFQGIVISDWGAVYDRVAGIRAGLDLQMPGDEGVNARKIIEAVKSRQLSRKDLDRVVLRLLSYLAVREQEEVSFPAEFDRKASRATALEAACGGAVLLKRGLLPLKPEMKLALWGRFAESPRYQGGGSAHVKPIALEDPLSSIQALSTGEVRFAPGYDQEGETSEELIGEALSAASSAEVIVVFAGLPESYETEGLDRTHLGIPPGHRKLIETALATGLPVVVVLQNGAVVEMPWADRVDSILETWLAGERVGQATADLLFGLRNPSGKLAETVPHRLEDTPAFLHFPGERDRVVYGEGLYVGYRYYSSKQLQVRYPFGHGLSYTHFEYRSCKTSSERIGENEPLTVKVELQNVGLVIGAEVVQVYLRRPKGLCEGPRLALAGFRKKELQPGENSVLPIEIEASAFQIFDENRGSWRTLPGEYEILVGSSSEDIRWKGLVSVRLDVVPRPLSQYSYLEDLRAYPAGKQLADFILGALPEGAGDFQRIMMETMPLLKLAAMSGGVVSPEAVPRIIEEIEQNPEKEISLDRLLETPEPRGLKSLFHRKRTQTASEMKLKDLLALPGGKTVLEGCLGAETLENPDFKRAVSLGLSMRQVQKFAPEQVKDSLLQEIDQQARAQGLL